MSRIKADFSKMKNSVQDEMNLTRELRQIEGEINGILSSLSMRSSSAKKIRESLRSNIQRVSTSRDKVSILYDTLMNIIQIYQMAENAAADGIESKELKESTDGAIKKAWEKLDSLRKQHGIQPLTSYSTDPVNLSTGNYVYEKVCMELDAEMDMKFRIFYNAQNQETGSLGRGWTHTWEVSLVHSEEEISMILDDGSRYSFMEEDGSYRAVPGTTATLSREENLDIVTDRNGVSFYFQPSGRLVRVEDRIGSYIVVEYDEAGRLCRAADRRGNFFRFRHDEAGHLQTVEDSAGRNVVLAWKDDSLSGVTDPQGRKTEYRYEEHGWLAEVINARGITCLVNTYDGQGRVTGQRFPDGGEMSYEYLDEKNQIVVTEQNGGQVIYEHDEFMRSTRTVYADGEETAEFDGNNNRVASTDKRGNTSRYSYDSAGNMVSFTNALEDKVTFSYNTKNQITQVELNGTMIHRSDYNERNLQVETENAVGAVDRYEYDEYGQPVVWVRADGSRVNLTYDHMGNLASITNAAGGCTRYEYNNKNQVIKTIDPLGNETLYAYNQADELTRVQDAAGNVQSFDYDACGNVILARDGSGAETVTEYNAMNKPVRVIEPDGAETVYEYDTMWNVTSVTAPDGGKTTYEYDQFQRVVKMTDPNGGVNTMEYDACGNLTCRTDPDGGVHRLKYDALNRPDYVCDPTGMEVRAEYDALGNVTAVLYSDGGSEHYKYDLLGNMTMSQNREGYQKFYEYDILGNLAVVSDSEGILEEYDYYPGGLLKSETYADGRSRHFCYDDNENVVKVVNQDGNQWEFVYDSLGRVVAASQEQGVEESYEYDALGNITAVTDGNGVKTVYGYRGKEIISVTDGMGGETRCLYDPCRRLTRVIQSDGKLPSADDVNAFNRSQKDIRVTDFRYDKNGNIVESTDPEGNRTSYTYDGNNRILTQTDGDGQETRCEYYPDGMVKSYHFADGRSVKMMYDPLKRLVEMEDWLGITRIQPDAVGRPRQVTGPEGDTIAYEWGQRGECRETVYPDGSRISYVYDEALRLVYSKIGEDMVSYQYYPNGKLKEKILPDEIKVCYQYNSAGYVSGITCTKEDDIIDALRYEYDRNGRKSRILRKRTGMEDSGNYEYLYNGAGGLTSVIKDGRQVEAYEYDGYGNRIFSQTGHREARYGYNRVNQLVSMWDEDGEHTYSYDCRGNLLSEQLDQILTRTLNFNAQGLLEQVRAAGKTVSYQYDGFGNRVRQQVAWDDAGSKESRFLYDMTRDFPRLLSVRNDGKTENLIWDGGLLGCQEGESVRYLLNDERMSPLRVVKNGSVCGAMSFDSFGNVLENTGTGTKGFGYAGYRPEPSGFMYVNARDYDARSGRFISRDLFSGIVTLPITFNAYSYAMGDPINRIDPTGMIAAWLGAGIVGAVVNVVTKVAGDVVESIATGKPHVSSWQSYLGAAAGGFTYGTVFAATGNMAAAGVAGGAVESFASNGLSMLTGKEGFRAEDGYSWKNLLGSTIKDGAAGAAAGYLFGQAGKYIKIPGINKGRGSFQAVWKQVMTKASRGQIANITLKTLGKGLVAYGGVRLIDQIIQKAKKKITDTLKEKAKELVVNILGGHRDSARCPLEG